jgi:hypothetical protein
VVESTAEKINFSTREIFSHGSPWWEVVESTAEKINFSTKEIFCSTGGRLD